MVRRLKTENIMTKSRKILVVDDERSIRQLLSDALSHKGFEVTEARDGQESLEKMERMDFDLVITDINMPRLDGISMVKQMEKAGRKEKIIIISGNASNQKVSFARMPQVIKQLLKPFRTESLVDLVVSATTHKPARNQPGQLSKRIGQV